MAWIYLSIPIAVIGATVAFGPIVAGMVLVRSDDAGRRADRDVPRPASTFARLEVDEPSVCAMCSCVVADDVTHWKAIHHVPA